MKQTEEDEIIMGVMIQAFYWDCPVLENLEHKWWIEVKNRIPALQRAGFTALWLPPVSKAASWRSMGYDPYDYFDLGEYDQKGGEPTWFGSKAELLDLIETAHAHGMQVYADLVFNHNSGGDAQEKNPIDSSARWTRFQPKSKRFTRDWSCFHPSFYEQWDNETFGDMPDLCHRNPIVYTELIDHAKGLLDIGFDGFRYDMVKGYGGWMVRAIQELRALRDDYVFKPFGVGECWDSDRVIEDWLGEANAWSDNPVSAFDFPLRDRLSDLCQCYGFSLRRLEPQPGALLYDRPAQAVTFVENHDVARSSPIIRDKLLAYAYILTHEGYPCVFWQDYFNWNLAQEGSRSGIAALVEVHEKHAGGGTRILHVDDDLYIMEREGNGAQHGLLFLLNNKDAWNGVSVQTKWQSTQLLPAAWWGSSNTGMPDDKWTDGDGWAELWAPPRGYAVYVPQ
jgi:alpha-amylase